MLTFITVPNAPFPSISSFSKSELSLEDVKLFGELLKNSLGFVAWCGLIPVLLCVACSNAYKCSQDTEQPLKQGKLKFITDKLINSTQHNQDGSES